MIETEWGIESGITTLVKNGINLIKNASKIQIDKNSIKICIKFGQNLSENVSKTQIHKNSMKFA